MHSAPSVLDEHERGTLYEEFGRYDVWDPPAHIEAAFEHGLVTPVLGSILEYQLTNIGRRFQFSQVKTGDELEFRVLAKLSTANTLCIPHGNAESEQIFSWLALTKIKFRSRMAGKTLNGILTVNFNVKDACYSFIPTKQMPQKARHPKQDEYK